LGDSKTVRSLPHRQRDTRGSAAIGCSPADGREPTARKWAVVSVRRLHAGRLPSPPAVAGSP